MQKRKSLSKWYSESLAGFYESLRAQNKYMRMNTTTLLEYLRLRNENVLDNIPNWDEGKNTVADTVQIAVDSLKLTRKDGDIQGILDAMAILHTILISPFAQWLTDTDYIPEPEYLENTCLSHYALLRPSTASTNKERI